MVNDAEVEAIEVGSIQALMSKLVAKVVGSVEALTRELVAIELGSVEKSKSGLLAKVARCVGVSESEVGGWLIHLKSPLKRLEFFRL